MRAIHIIDSVYPDRTAGAFTYAWELARRLAARGHDIDMIVTKPDPGAADRETIDGFRVHRYALPDRKHDPRTFFVRVAGARKVFLDLVRERDPDLLHLQSPMNTAGVLASRASRAIPRIATLHGPGIGHEYLCEARLVDRGTTTGAEDAPPLGIRDRAYVTTVNAVEGWYVRRCDRILSLSQYCLDVFDATHGLDRQRTAVVPGGVDVERYCPGDRVRSRERLGWTGPGPTLFTMRRMTPRMGIPNLVEAMIEVRRAEPAARLVLGGDGPLRSAIEDRIQQAGLNGVVELAGRIPDDLVSTYYRAADLFVLPTRAAEGFGLVTLEALACNTPAFGTPIGGTVELLEAVNRDLLFEDSSPSAMARKIISFCRDRDRYTRDYHSLVSKTFGWPAVIDQVERHYEEVAAAGRLPTPRAAKSS